MLDSSAVDRGHRWPVIGISLLVVTANLPVALRYTGDLGTLAYVGACCVLVGAVLRWWPKADFWRWATLIGVLLGLMGQLFLLAYVSPLYQGHMDRDDALVLWWQRILQGTYPYALPTGRGNPISILPFLHLIALPFIELGNVGYLMIVSTIGIAILVWRRYAGNPIAQSLALLFLVTAPVVAFEVAGRSDILVNMLIFALLVLGIEEYVHGKHALLPWIGLLIGAAAATRIAIWPALAVPVIYLLGHLRPRQSATVLAIALIVFGVLVGPFAVWNPAIFFNYAPLGVNATKLGTEPAVRVLWVVLTLTVVLLATVYAWKTGRLFVSSLPVLACVTFATWMTFGVDVSYVQLLFVPLLFSFPRRAIA